MKKIKFLKKNELVAVAVVVAAAVLALVLWPRGKAGLYAQVSYDNTVIQRIPLTEDGVYPVDADLPVTLEVADGKIRFLNSVCPDKLCEDFGWIGEEYQYAICLPAGVAVQIMAEG